MNLNYFLIKCFRNEWIAYALNQSKYRYLLRNLRSSEGNLQLPRWDVRSRLSNGTTSLFNVASNWTGQMHSSRVERKRVIPCLNAFVLNDSSTHWARLCCYYCWQNWRSCSWVLVASAPKDKFRNRSDQIGNQPQRLVWYDFRTARISQRTARFGMLLRM